VARLDLVLLYPAAIHVPRAHSQVRLGVGAAVLQRIDVLIRTGSDLTFFRIITPSNRVTSGITYESKARAPSCESTMAAIGRYC